ncbi:hypothetical protein ACFC63_07835 [Streptomyces albidoflavus]
MSADVVPYSVAVAGARRALDAARHRRDLDRAAGRLDPAVELILRRLERQQRQTPAEHRTAA